MLIPTQAWKTARQTLGSMAQILLVASHQGEINAVLILLPFLLFKMDKVELSAYSK